jgi:hypothetical protein
MGAVMVFSPLAAGAWRSGLDLLAATQGLARGFGNNDRGDATLRRGPATGKAFIARRSLFHSRGYFFRSE